MKKIRYWLSWLPELLWYGPKSTHVLVLRGIQKGHQIIMALIVFRALIYAGVLLSGMGRLNDSPVWLILCLTFLGTVWVGLPGHMARLYLHAWADCRSDIMDRLQESTSAVDFVQSLMYHDAVHVMGLTPPVPDTPEGLDE